MGGASRQRRCRTPRARYATHESEQPIGRVLGIRLPTGKASWRSTVTTGDLVGSLAVSIPPSPWQRRVHVSATRMSQADRDAGTRTSASRVEGPAGGHIGEEGPVLAMITRAIQLGGMWPVGLGVLKETQDPPRAPRGVVPRGGDTTSQQNNKEMTGQQGHGHRQVGSQWQMPC
jgi:hypothetical protein